MWGGAIFYFQFQTGARPVWGTESPLTSLLPQRSCGPFPLPCPRLAAWKCDVTHSLLGTVRSRCSGCPGLLPAPTMTLLHRRVRGFCCHRIRCGATSACLTVCPLPATSVTGSRMQNRHGCSLPSEMWCAVGQGGVGDGCWTHSPPGQRGHLAWAPHPASPPGLLGPEGIHGQGTGGLLLTLSALIIINQVLIRVMMLVMNAGRTHHCLLLPLPSPSPFPWPFCCLQDGSMKPRSPV